MFSYLTSPHHSQTIRALSNYSKALNVLHHIVHSGKLWDVGLFEQLLVNILTVCYRIYTMKNVIEGSKYIIKVLLHARVLWLCDRKLFGMTPVTLCICVWSLLSIMTWQKICKYYCIESPYNAIFYIFNYFHVGTISLLQKQQQHRENHNVQTLHMCSLHFPALISINDGSCVLSPAPLPGPICCVFLSADCCL